MTLRVKMLLIMCSTLLVLLAAVYAASSRLLLGGFAGLEEEAVRRNLQRVEGAVGGELAHLDSLAADWARWDASYAFVEHAGEAYIKTNVSEGMLASHDVDLMLFVGAEGNLVYGVSLNRETRKGGPPAAGIVGELAGRGVLLRHPDTGSVQKGLVSSSQGPMLVVSRPILTSHGAGPIRGSLIIARVFDAARLRSLAELTQVSVAAYGLDDPHASEEVRAAWAALGSSRRTLVAPLGEGWIAGYATLADVARRPALMLRVDSPRSILKQGEATLRYLILTLLAVGVVFGVVMFTLLERTVLSRLAAASAAVGTIAASRNLSARVHLTGNDELTRLAGAINGMLEALDHSQRGLGESEERYRAVVEQAWDSIFLFDPETARLVEVNASFQRLLGYSPAEALALTVYDIVAEREGVDREIQRVRRERRCYIGERTYRRMDGSHLVVDATSSLVTYRGREVICVAVRDITERKLIEERFRQAQKLELVGSLAGGVAHDVNNLLQAILSAAEVLRMRGADPPARAEALAALDAQVKHGAALTRQLLLIARQDVLKPELLDLNRVVRDTGGFLRHVIRENIRLDFVLVEEPLPVTGDGGQLEQALVNLVVNAVEAMPEGGALTVRTGATNGREVWFEVSDSGPGMPEEIRARVFEPFFTTKAPGHGMGLGLTVVLGIVSDHHGRIEVTTREGAGSTFLVLLPRSSAPAAAEAPAAVAAPERLAGHGERVLLVEDEEGARGGLTEMLRLLGYEVTAVASGEEAEATSKRLEFDALLTDFMLTGIHGGELARRLLARSSGLKVLVMSGYGEDEVIRRGLSEGRVRFLPKPFGMDTLARELRSVIDE